MNKKKLQKIWLFLGVFLSGCFRFMPFKCEDISNTFRVNHLINHRLVLKQDTFLYQYPDTKTYALDIPGGNTVLPSSILEYKQDPINWVNTDSNAQKGCGLAQGYLKLKIIDVIPAGTTLRVYQVLEEITHYESFMSVLAHLEDSVYSSLSIDIISLLKKDYGKIIIPYPSEPELTVMGREKIPYPKPGVIEYCDEPFPNAD